MPSLTAAAPAQAPLSQPNAGERFEAIVGSGFLGVRVPSHMDGHQHLRASVRNTTHR